MKIGETYVNGQKVTQQNGNILTYFFENGEIKAQGEFVNDVMRGQWIFNKKNGDLWQVGNFDDMGNKHGDWTIFNKDGSPQKEKTFKHGKVA